MQRIIISILVLLGLLGIDVWVCTIIENKYLLVLFVLKTIFIYYALGNIEQQRKNAANGLVWHLLKNNRPKPDQGVH